MSVFACIFLPYFILGVMSFVLLLWFFLVIHRFFGHYLKHDCSFVGSCDIPSSSRLLSNGHISVNVLVCGDYFADTYPVYIAL